MYLQTSIEHLQRLRVELFVGSLGIRMLRHDRVEPSVLKFT